MRAVVQRVSEARVQVAGKVVGAIEAGMLVYLGVDHKDTPDDARYLADKVAGLRIFPDEHKALNRDVKQVDGAMLVVSAFTVQADARKGRRPSLDSAAKPEHAEELYRLFCEMLAAAKIPVQRGAFGADMSIHSVNAGPVCLLLDSGRQF